MNRNQKLFDLVIAMSLSEKIFFKKISTTNGLKSKQYLKLFDAVKKQTEWNEEKLLKKLKNEPFIKHFSVTKSYLYQAILQSLEVYYRDCLPKSKFFQYHNQIQVLIHKRLFKQAEQLLKKAKRLAQQEQYFDVLCQFNYLEISMLIGSENIEKISKRLEDLNNEFEDLNHKYQIQYKFLQLSAKFLKILRTSKKINEPEYQKELKWIRTHPLMQSPLEFGTTLDKTRYYNLKAMLAIFDGDIEAAHPLLQTHLDIYEQHPKLVLYNPLNYVLAFQNLINNCRRLKKEEEYETLIKKMKQIPSRYQFKDKDNILPIILIRSYAYEATFYYNKKQYVKFEETVIELEKDLKKYKDKVEKVWLFVIAYGIAEFYFDIKNDSEKSIFWLNTILMDKEEQIAPNYQLAARLLQICIYLHLNQERFVTHKIKEIKVFMNKYNMKIDFVKKFLKHLKKINFSANKAEKKAAITELQNSYSTYKNSLNTYSIWLQICEFYLKKELK